MCGAGIVVRPDYGCIVLEGLLAPLSERVRACGFGAPVSFVTGYPDIQWREELLTDAVNPWPTAASTERISLQIRLWLVLNGNRARSEALGRDP